jgi:alanyl-tRNA synthetase
MRTADEIREAFMEFFRRRGHTIVSSAPVVPHGDPSLMFTNAGMNQFKDVFLGTGKRDYTRCANTQKCIRVSGKHNDLEEVGVDTYHHTFFEMLGNWSFGDYFKKEAIRWGWEFLVDTMGLPGDKLWATVFGGDDALGLQPDTEAEQIWPEETGIPAERVLRFGVKDNFWEMAETGPCGPCSEIHIDLGPEACDKKGVEGHECRVNGECGRYFEVWNLVFIQYNRIDRTTLKPLPARHVDTGMGFERLVAVCQSKSSNYDTDLFTPLLAKIGELTDKAYGESDKVDAAMRVVADHVRALSVAIADGALPGNKDRGYVLRRILRRALRFGYQVLGRDTPFIHEVVPVVADVLGTPFPELHTRLGHVQRVVLSEEEAFLRTLDRGIDRFESIAASIEESGESRFDGEVAYDLYSTYGFPKDLIELMARERNLKLDESGWDKAESEHRLASAGEREERFDPSELEGLPATEFVGYWEDPRSDEMGTRARVKALKLIGNEYLILDRTPFYAEAGGQVGDTGVVTADGFRFVVTDTGRLGDIWFHQGEVEQADDLTNLPEEAIAQVDRKRRLKIMANHTVTHLLHWALRKNVSEEATQQGSLVDPDYLRFDFTHDEPLTDEELQAIEKAVNERIADDHPVEIRRESYQEAIEQGVTALFGEKYGEEVRVVKIDDVSQELCGGTHCRRTGQIGYFQIVSEKAVSAGVRRIVAETRLEAVARAMEQRRLLEQAAQALNTSPEELPARIEQLQKKIKELKKGTAKAKAINIKRERQRLLDQAERIDGVSVVVAQIDANPKQLGELADALRGGSEPVAGLLATAKTGKSVLVAFASKDLSKKGKVHAGNLVRSAAEVAGGRGGGRPDFAKGGSKETENLPAALEQAKKTLKESLS